MRDMRCPSSLVIYILICLWFVRPAAAQQDADDDDAYGDVVVQPAQTSARDSQFVGTNLLGLSGARKRCFTNEDVALLVARKEYEKLLPYTNSTIRLQTDSSVLAMLEFFAGAQSLVHDLSGPNTRHAAAMAMCDTIGGYMHFVYVPLVRTSFYAGTVDYTNTMAVLRMQSQLRRRLNTNGNGWRRPRADWFQPARLPIEALNISRWQAAEATAVNADEPQPCANLILSERSDDRLETNRMLVDLPRLHPTGANAATASRLALIWMPLRQQRIYNLAAQTSAFVLLRYYADVQRCYTFKGLSSHKFERRFGDWLADCILPYVQDVQTDAFYPGLGAVLRVARTVHTGDSRRPSDIKRSSDRTDAGQAFADIEHQVAEILKNRRETGVFDRLYTSVAQKKDELRERLDLKNIAAMAGVLIVAVCCLCSCCLWRLRRREPVVPPLVPSIRPPSTAKTATKGRSKFCPRWVRGGPPAGSGTDEEVVDCMPDSPSVMHSQWTDERQLGVTEYDEHLPRNGNSRGAGQTRPEVSNTQHTRNIGAGSEVLNDLATVTFAATPKPSDDKPMKQIVVADIHRDGGDKLSARSTTSVQQTLIRKEQTLAQERRGKLSSSNTYAAPKMQKPFTPITWCTKRSMRDGRNEQDP